MRQTTGESRVVKNSKKKDTIHQNKNCFCTKIANKLIYEQLPTVPLFYMLVRRFRRLGRWSLPGTKYTDGSCKDFY